MSALQQVFALYNYNVWAWRRVFRSLMKLEAEEYHKARPFFWESLHGLAVHCLAAEWIWRQRLAGKSPGSLWNPVDFKTFEEVQQRWQSEWQEWRLYLDKLSYTDLDQVLSYRTTEGTERSLAIGDILIHVMNHATEHRSQMTPVLHQLGVATEPLDYMLFRLTLG